MRLVRLQWGLALLLAIGCLGFGHAAHAQPVNISQKVGVCDPKFPSNCIKPLADGSVNVNGGGGSSLSVNASSAPTPVSAGAQPLNEGLFSNLFTSLVDPVSGTALALLDTPNTGTLNSATSNAAYTVPVNAQGVVSFVVTGLTGTGATLTIEGSDNGAVSYTAVTGLLPVTGALITTLTTDQQFRVNAGGRDHIRLRVSATGTGTVSFASVSSGTQPLVALSSPIPGCVAPCNLIGHVDGAGANNATPAGNPSLTAGVAQSAEPTLATTGQTAQFATDLAHKLITLPYANPENFVSGLTAAMTVTTSTAFTGMGAPGAGLRNYITQLTCGNSHATVGTFVNIQDGSGGTTFYTVPAGAVYQGAAISFPTPLRQPTANTGLFAVDATTGANVICSASGYKGS